MESLLSAVCCVLISQSAADPPASGWTAANRQQTAAQEAEAGEVEAASDSGRTPAGSVVEPPSAGGPKAARDTRQEGPAPSLSADGAVVTAPEAPLVPVDPAARRTTPAAIVAEAARLPGESRVDGRPWTLLEALASARDAPQQLDVTHAYWRSFGAVAEYHFALQHFDALRRMAARAEDAALLRTARASAAAAARVAELAVVAAQHELAEAAALPTSDPLPLPADLPHVGTYHTHFDDVFSARNPPARAGLIHRKLPIGRRAIEVRARAVEAAEDAFQSALRAYGFGQMQLADVLSSQRHLSAQQTALIDSVCKYNHEIAEYALSVAGSQPDRRVLVAMLIDPSRQPGRLPVPTADAGGAAPTSQGASGPPSEVEPAIFNAPVTTRRNGESAEGAPRGGLDSLGVPAPTSALPEEPAASASRSARKPVFEDAEVAEPTAAYYLGLAGASPAVQAKYLTMEWHRSRSLPEGVGESVKLKQCLAGLAQGDRGDVIGAYWLAAERAARYQVVVAHGTFLDELVPIVLSRRDASLGEEDIVRLRAAGLAAEADALAAHSELLESQFELTRLAARPLGSSWLLPATAPHCGPYLLKLEAQPREVAESWPVRRLASMIPGLAEGLQGRAAAVVEADAARAEAAAAYRSGSRSIEHVLGAIEQQTDETLAFLETLTRYNRAIADYVLTVLPAEISAEQLAETLVVAP